MDSILPIGVPSGGSSDPPSKWPEVLRQFFREYYEKAIDYKPPDPPPENALFTPDQSDAWRFMHSPPERDYLLQDQLMHKTVALLVGAGGSKKTWVAMELAVKVALCGIYETNWLGAFKVVKGGKALFVSAEDSEDEVHRRFHSIALSTAANLGIAPERLWEALKGRLHVVSLVGRVQPIIQSQGDGMHETSEYFDALCSTISQYDGLVLVVFDTRCRFSGVDENNNAAVSREVCAYEAIAQKFDTTMLVLHHISKAAIRNKNGPGRFSDQTSSRGASAFVDNSRWVAEISVLPENVANDYGIDPSERRSYSMIEIVKSNYGEIPNEPILLFQKQPGWLEHINMVTAKQTQQTTEETIITEIIRNNSNINISQLKKMVIQEIPTQNRITKTIARLLYNGKIKQEKGGKNSWNLSIVG